MIKFILLTLLELVLCYVSLHKSQHCECKELGEKDCNKLPYWCIWQNSTCLSHNQDCESLLDEDTCFTNPLQCAWQSAPEQKCLTRYPSDSNNGLSCVQSGYYWLNNTCSNNFTRCEDYSVDLCYYLIFKQRCYTKDKKCIFFEYANCSSQPCIQDYTSPDETHDCEERGGTCREKEIKNPCPPFNESKEMCEYDEKCFYDNSICRFQKCSDIDQEDSCKNKTVYDIDQQIWCEWKDSKCQNMTEIINKDETNCLVDTFYNYKWGDKKCIQCSNLISNTPIYGDNSTNNTNSTGNNTNSTGNNTNSTGNYTELNSTDPVYINLNQRCACSQFQTYSDCSIYALTCTWDYEQNICQSFNSECASRLTSSSCEYAGCVWQSSQCLPFITCSDFLYEYCPVHRDCYVNIYNECETFSSCSYYDTYSCPTNKGCIVSYNYCSQISQCDQFTEEDCQGKYEQTNYPCYLDNDGNCKSKFSLIKFQVCSDFDDSKIMCESLDGCIYNNEKCILGKCYQFTKIKCRQQRDSNGIAELCQWDPINNNCGYAKLGSLSSSECNKYQNLKYDQQCLMCTYLEDNHATIISSKSLEFILVVQQFLVMILLIN